nr:hypothetical protein [Tanacetum cinerariifolium]
AANRVRFVGLGMERSFLSQKDSGVGRGVKEKQQGYSSGNGGALSSSDATNTQLDVNVSVTTNVDGNGGARSSGNGNAPSSVDATNMQLPTAKISATDTPGNSAVNKEDNLHDESDGLTPSKSTANTNKAISERFSNTAYGFFLGKRVAYPVIANCVRNTWGTYGLNLDVKLLKEDVGNVSVWVKLNGVPVTAFIEHALCENSYFQ